MNILYKMKKKRKGWLDWSHLA